MHNVQLYILESTDTHFWYSCNVILEAIKEAFVDQKEVKWLNAFPSLSSDDLHLIESSSITKTTYIYLASDNLDFEIIIKSLNHIKNLSFIIPIYGNMTVEFIRWEKLNELLKNKPVYLLCASHRQCQQLSVFVNGSTIKKIPYPISTKNFECLRNSQLNRETISLVYCGRLTVQKNILPLMATFLDAIKLNPSLRLEIAGEFHDRGYHLHGIVFDQDQFKKEFFELVKRSKGSIVYHGFLEQEDIIKLNSSCDYVISMSTYHDEDFGVSVSQSLAQGLSPILSDWGGHSDFIENIPGVLIPVRVDGDNIPHFSAKHLFMNLVSIEKPTKSDRLRIAEIARSVYSSSRFLESFEKLLTHEPSQYLGQNEFYLHYAKTCHTYYPFAGSPSRISYIEIYKSYLSDYIDKEKFS